MVKEKKNKIYGWALISKKESKIMRAPILPRQPLIFKTKEEARKRKEIYEKIAKVEIKIL